MSACDCSHDSHVNFDGVLFDVSTDGAEGVYPDWIIKPRLNLVAIPGTNLTYVEHMGFDPARVTWKLSFCCLDTYNEMLARYLTTATLSVLYGYQSLKGSSTPTSLFGKTYEHLDNVMLFDIDDTPHFVGGSVEAMVTFLRAVDPVTRLAVIA